jgi:predicted outer membrane repeat protein
VSSADEQGDLMQPNGGAVFMSGAVLQTGLCVMDDNQAGNSGGAMYLQDACSLVRWEGRCWGR